MSARNILIGLALFAAPAATLAGEGDIWIYQQNGRLTTGSIEEFPGLDREAGVRVFAGELGVDVPNAGDEPGLRILDGDFAVGTQIGFNIRRALRQWDGSNFDTLSPHTMTISFGPASQTTPIADPFAPIPGFNVPVDSEGGLHDHWDFLLNAGSLAANGVFLLDVELTTTAPGVATSEFIWILFGQGVDEVTLEAAEDWAASNIPAPGSLALLVAGAIPMLRRRR